MPLFNCNAEDLLGRYSMRIIPDERSVRSLSAVGSFRAVEDKFSDRQKVKQSVASNCPVSNRTERTPSVGFNWTDIGGKSNSRLQNPSEKCSSTSSTIETMDFNGLSDCIF